MKKNLLYWILISVCTFIFIGCSDDEDFHPTIFNPKDDVGERTPLDQWIWDEFTGKYNIRVIYRWDDFEANSAYELVPPKEDRVRPFLETIVKGWVKAYEESTAGPVFFKTMAPKQIMLVGSAGFNTDGTYVIGEAEQGNKITIYNINMNDPTAESILDGNLRVFHHEFSHVLHHTQEYPEAFELISAGDYTSEWSSVARPNTVGFISSYAAMDPDEDFAEMVSWFIDRDSAGWEGHMIAGGNAEGSRKLREKESIMLNYMRNVWNIDLYQIRASVRRAKDEILGKTTTVEDSE